MPLLLLIGAILIECWILARLIESFGPAPVLLWLLAAVAVGMAVIRRQGLRTIREVQAATARGELPAAALLEGLIALVAGLLLILPGVVSDFLAATMLLPGLRRGLAQRLTRGLQNARPDLRPPVTLEGEYRREDR